MAKRTSGFLDKVLGRIDRLDHEGLQSVVQRLARERNFLENLLDTIEDGVLVVDGEGRIQYFNEAVTRLLGIPEDAMEGHDVTRYLPFLEEDLSLIELLGHDGRVIRRDFETVYPKRRFLRVLISGMKVGKSARGDGVTMILHDATEARQETFEAAESERVQALTLLSASVAHEIGNPLNALHIHLQLMEREVKKVRRQFGLEGMAEPEVHRVTEPLARYLGVCKGEISRLDYIITQFLQAIRPTQPKLKLGDLNPIIQETVALLKPELDDRGLAVVEEYQEALPKVYFDSVQIKQALVNLIKNAMQAMTRGGGLELKTYSLPDWVWLEIRDEGVGIPQERINRLFEPYFTTKEKGSGLGLMIVHRIIRDHGGRVEVESAVGKGTLFRLGFPREKHPKLLNA